MYDYLFVLDFEATCCEYNEFPRHEMEVIEFPIVVIDNKTNEIIDEFHQYVKPMKHPKLTAFCTQLTGIKQSTVDNAEPFFTVFRNAKSFLEKYENGIFITCGNWDLKTMLPQQVKNVPYKFKIYMNIQDEFKKKYKTRSTGMVAMLNHLNLKLIGRHHSGIDDTRNTARIVLELKKNNPKFLA
jgi:ERI1 exoribonuclease 3